MSTATARELRQRVAAKYGKRSEVLSFPEHVVLFEVPFLGRSKVTLRDGETVHDLDTRLRSRQRFDVLALGVWPKTKQLVHGFELKVSRADLLHELRDLSKSEHAARMVDRFWLVLGDRTILHDDDQVPASWGILFARGRGLWTLREADPQPGRVDRELLLGAVTRALVQPTIGREVRHRDGWIKGRREGYEIGRDDERNGWDRKARL